MKKIKARTVLPIFIILKFVLYFSVTFSGCGILSMHTNNVFLLAKLCVTIYFLDTTITSYFFTPNALVSIFRKVPI